MSDLVPNPTAAEILREDFLAPLGLTNDFTWLAEKTGLSIPVLVAVIYHNRRIDAEIDEGLSMAFMTAPGFWLGLQADYDVMETKRKVA